MSRPIVDGWVVDEWGDAGKPLRGYGYVEVGGVDAGGHVRVQLENAPGHGTVLFFVPAEVLAHQLRAAGWTVTAPGKAGEP